MAVTAELLPDPGTPALELAAARRLGLPPGSVPVEPVRQAVRYYRSGAGRPERGAGRAGRLVEAVDRHSEALGEEIARLQITHLAEMARLVTRLEALHDRTADLIAQARWLREFPSEADQPPAPLAIVLDGRRFAVPVVLAAVKRTVTVDERIVLRARRQRSQGRRGSSASMAALADRGFTSSDIAQAAGLDRSRAWAMLNGRQRVTPELRAALVRLLGSDHAAIVLDGIPVLPRGRSPASAAVEALHAAGATAEDVAELIPVQPGTVRCWLRGTYRPSPKLAPALEQAVGGEAARMIVSLIPGRVISPD